MSDFETLVKRMTHRLGVDPELQMDVACELRTHLEDSAAEFRREGLSDADADEKACKAMGDADELAEQLWNANRRRMRVRGLLRWGARVTLVPAAIAVVLSLIAGLSLGEPFNLLRHIRSPVGPYLSGRRIPASWAAELTEDELFLLEGDPAAKTLLERDKSIADRWPNNPVFYGNYVVSFMDYRGWPGGWRGRSHDEPVSESEMLDILDHGERIDPDNAFYNFSKAVVLVRASSKIEEDDSRTCMRTDRSGDVTERKCPKIEIHDLAKFERGLAEFRLGLSKPQLTHRALEMLQLRLDLLPEPKRLNDYVRRLGMDVLCLLPPLSQYKDLARALSAHAIALAEAGRRKQAVELVRSVERMGLMMGTQSQSLIDLLVAEAIRRVALANTEHVYKELGDTEAAGTARAVFEQEQAFFNALLNKSRQTDSDRLRHAGLLWSVMLPWHVEGPVDFEPIRSAEQAVATQIALFVLLIALILLMLLLGAGVLLDLLVHARKPDARGVLVFVGWRRMGRICLLAIGVPLAAYAFYAYVLTAGYREYGLNHTLGKTVLEFAVAGGTACMLLLVLAYSAVRARAEEIGITVPAPVRLRNRPWAGGIATLIVLSALVYVVGWWAGAFQPKGRPLAFDDPHCIAGLLLAAGVVLYLIAWTLREYVGLARRKHLRRFRHTLSRSLVPILASSVIVVGVLCGWSLARVERSAAARIKGPAALSFPQELNRSAFRHLKERLIRQQNARLEESQQERHE